MFLNPSFGIEITLETDKAEMTLPLDPFLDLAEQPTICCAFDPSYSFLCALLFALRRCYYSFAPSALSCLQLSCQNGPKSFYLLHR